MPEKIHLTRSNVKQYGMSPIGVVTPEYIGQYCMTNDKVFFANGLTKDNWVEVGSSIIDDENISYDATWSSSKILSEIGNDKVIKKALEQIRKNQLELLVERDLNEESISMDTGYWFDSLKNDYKIVVATSKIEDNMLKSTGEKSVVIFRPHKVGFKSSKAVLYFNRNKGKKIKIDSANNNIVNLQKYSVNVEIGE